MEDSVILVNAFSKCAVEMRKRDICILSLFKEKQGSFGHFS